MRGVRLDLARVDRRDFLRNCNIVIGGHLRVRLADKTIAAAGDTVALEIAPVAVEPEPGVPADLRKALATNPAAQVTTHPRK